MENVNDGDKDIHNSLGIGHDTGNSDYPQPVLNTINSAP